MDDGDGLTPITLAAEKPVAEAVGNFFLTQALFFQPGYHLGNGIFLVETI